MALLILAMAVQARELSRIELPPWEQISVAELQGQVAPSHTVRWDVPPTEIAPEIEP